MLILIPSCTSGKKELGAAILERDSLPLMTTYDVNSLISDSGVIRYRLEADEWQVFDKKNPSYWAFEKGALLEQFDSLFNIDARVKADTAYYFDKKKLWELRGNVKIENHKGEKFYTQLLFWDEAKQRIYSNKYIRIEQEGGKELIGNYGFESNQSLTKYEIYNNQGIFPFDEEPKKDTLKTNNDSIVTDTIKNRP